MDNYSFISIYHSNCGTNYTSRTDTSTQRDLTTSVTLGGKVTLGGWFAKNGQYYIVLYVTIRERYKYTTILPIYKQIKQVFFLILMKNRMFPFYGIIIFYQTCKSNIKLMNYCQTIRLMTKLVCAKILRLFVCLFGI